MAKNNKNSDTQPLINFSDDNKGIQSEGGAAYGLDTKSNIDPHKKQKILEAIEDDEVVLDHLENAVDVNEFMLAPNVVDNASLDVQIMKIVNGSGGTVASQSMWGTKIIEPGKIGIVSRNGKIEVVGAGRWMIMNPRAHWINVVALTQNPIHHETLTIVRVPKGQVGLAYDGGRPVLLAEGVHVKNSRLFQHVRLENVNQKHINHGTIHILMVPKGEYALVTETNVPKILQTGRYVTDSDVFSCAGFQDMNQAHIAHRSIHILRVPKGKLALIEKDNKPYLIPEGTHFFNSQVFNYRGLQDMNQESIIHGTITRFRVRNGEIGLAWDNNKPVFIEKPDFYEVDSPSFNFVKCVSAAQQEIILGSLKRIIVYDGEVGISYDSGKLKILEPKTHVFDASDLIFKGVMSTRQRVLSLGRGDDYLRCDTKDFVEIGIKADVFYKVKDPERALLEVGAEDDISKLIRETAIATLQSIIRSSSLNQVAQSKEVHAISESAMHSSGGGDDDGHNSSSVSIDPGNKPSAPLFFEKVHDEFISKLHDIFLKKYGIEIANIRIENFKIMDKELADNISKQAMITATTETKLANLEGQREIATAEMERDAAVQRIKSQSMANNLQVDTAAQNRATMEQATAKANAAKIIAQGEADALLISVEAEAKAIERKAQAEAQSIELKAQAEAKRAEMLGKTSLGSQLALYELQTDMVQNSLKGIQKIVYLPTDMAKSPFGLFGLPGVNHSLLEDGGNFNTSDKVSSSKSSK